MTLPTNKLKKNDNILEDNRLSVRSKRFFDEVADPIVTGSGSPEGVIVALQTTLYMDTAGTAGSILYIKRDADIGGDRSLGWILV